METDASHPDLFKSTRGTKVHAILQTFYQTVLTLDEWIRRSDREGHLQSSLVTEEDQKGYKHLLETTLVAVKAGSKQLTFPVSLSQDSHQHELITRCVQRVLHRVGAGNNVLSFGFGPRTDNPKASVSTILNLEYRYPNSSVSRLQYKVWKTLLSRIGDTLMSHLLENTSLFILLVKPAVYLQITGEPVYQLWPYSSGSPRITKRYRPHSGKTAGNKVQAKQIKAGRSRKQTQRKRKKSLSHIPAMETDKSTGSAGTLKSPYTSLKRKRNDHDDNKCHKKQKLAEDEGCSESPTQQSSSDISLTVVPETSESSAENISGEHVCSMEREHSAEKCSGAKVALTSKKEKKRQKRLRKQRTAKPCTSGTSAFRHHLYMPKLSLLYGKYLREKFPANFSLGRFSPSEEGAESLLADIFIQDNVGGNMSKYGQQCQCQETEPFPKNNRSVKSSLPYSVKMSSSVLTTSSHCNRKKVRQNRSGSEGSCITSANLTDRTVQQGAVEQRTEIMDDSDAGKQLYKPSDVHSVTHSSENSRPTQASVEEIKPWQTSSSSNTVKSFIDRNLVQTPSMSTSSSNKTARSSMDIHLVESPSLSSQISSTASSSVVISNASSDVECCFRPPPITDRSSSHFDGCNKDQTVHQFSTIHTPEEPFPKNVDQERSVHTSTRPAGKEMQLYPKKTLPGSKAPALKVVKGVFPDKRQQKRVAVGIEPEGNMIAQKEVRGAPQENSATPVFKKKVLPLLHTLLLNHRKCKYQAVLSRCCPSHRGKGEVSKCQTTTNNLQKGQQSAAASGPRKRGHRIRRKKADKSTATAELLENYVSHQKAFAFLQAVVKQTVPVQLFGSSANMTVFVKNVHRLISSGKYEKMCLGQLMKGMKVKGCAWLSEVACQMEKEHRMAQVLWWLVVSYIFPVIRTFFYVTDTTTYRNRLFYYRKGTWLRLKTRAVEEFRKATCLKAISKAEASDWLSSGQSLGVSVLRFLPKVRSLRPIVNMSHKPREGSQQKKSINEQLKKVFQVFTSEKALDGAMCGCSVFGLNDTHKKLKEFKEKRTAHHDNRELYFVKSDVRNCFDSIQQHQLYQIVKDILDKTNEQAFMTRKYASVYLAGERMKRAFHSHTSRLSLYQPDFVTFLRKRYPGGRWNDIIVVDTAFFHEDKADTLLQVLSSHLFKNIIQIGQRHYLQRRGISQGSVMSTLLASIYLAYLDKTHLGAQDDELLIRRMDDYLFLTPHKPRAEQFVHTMLNGFPDFNCFTSMGKILTNFPVTHPTLGAVKHTQEGMFPWCGLMINTSSLELSVDYSRYTGLSITDTVTFDTNYKAGQTVSHKLQMCLKIKCHAIFFDLEVNSRDRVVLNVYQALLFVALTFHSIVVKLPPSRRLQANPRFFIGIIREIPSYTQNLVARNLKQAMCAHRVPIPLQMLQWLTADAFLVRLHHFPGYKPLKKFLTAWKRAAQKKMDDKDLCLLRETHKTAMKLDSMIVLFKKAW